MRQLVVDLAKKYTVGILSGRDLKDVQKHVKISDIIYAGSHGFDILSTNDQHLEYDEGKRFLPTLDKAEEELKQQIEAIEGAWVERKKYSVAIHYRQTPEEKIKDVEKLVDEVHGNHPNLRKALGK